MNICIVGYGSIAEVHRRSLARIPGVEVTAVVGRLLEPTQEFAAKCNAPLATIEIEEALAQDDLDAVVITSPSAKHAAQTQAALEAGKHVLVEIPLALSLAESEALTALAESNDLYMMVAHTMRFWPTLAAARQFIAEGELHVHSVFIHYGFLRRENVNWQGRRRSWTDNLLWHHGCHAVDTALWLLGEPAQDVTGYMGPPHQELGIPLDLAVSMRTPREQLVSCALSYNTMRPLLEIIIIGEETTLAIRDGKLVDPNDRIVAAGGENEEASAVYLQDIEFITALRQERDPIVSGDAVLPTMRALQAVQDLNPQNPRQA
jgi:2-hydroxy-4-carboxymuconate semialdehyde hemiacetal dehydrogenase